MSPTELVAALRNMHHDLDQEAYFTKYEDPTWDVTLQAADLVELLTGVPTLGDIAQRLRTYRDIGVTRGSVLFVVDQVWPEP